MSDTPRTDALSTFLVTQFPATLGNLELHKKLTELEQLERELTADAAVMRAALERVAGGLCCRNDYHDMANAALTTNAGREYCAAVVRLRNERDEACNKRAEANARISSDSLRMQLMTEELTTLRRKLAAAEGMADQLRFLSDYMGQNFPMDGDTALADFDKLKGTQ